MGLELFGILTLVVGTRIYKEDKMVQNSLHIHTHVHTQMSTGKTEENLISSVASVTGLGCATVLEFYTAFVLGMGGGYMGSLCIISYNHMSIYNHLNRNFN